MYVLGENLPNAKIMPHVPIFYHLDKGIALGRQGGISKAEQYYVLTDQPEKYEEILKEKDCSV